MNYHRSRLLSPRQLALAVLLLLPVLRLAARSQSQRVAQATKPPAMRTLTTTDKVCALTFDDGPDRRFTPRMLDELRKRRIRATFFVIGEQVALYPEIAKRLVAEGHVIGNHSYTHPWLDRMPDDIVAAELKSSDEVITRVTGKPPTLFRPPRGGLTPTIIRQCAERKLKIVRWSVCADNQEAPTPQLMAQRVLDRAEPGMIVLIHDGRMAIREKDVQALPLILDGLQKLGYVFVPLEGKWVK